MFTLPLNILNAGLFIYYTLNLESHLDEFSYQSIRVFNDLWVKE